MRRTDHTAEPVEEDDLKPIRTHKQIAEILNARGVLTATGRRWTRSHVQATEQRAIAKLAEGLREFR